MLCVPPRFVVPTLKHVGHFIDQAFASGMGDDDAASVRADLVSGSAVLWVVWSGAEFIAAAVTKIIATPAKRLCVISCCGGTELHRWRHFIADLEDYARQEGCDAMRIMGRRGWKAIFRDYREPWACLEKGLR